MYKSVKIKDFITRNPITFKTDMSIYDAVASLLKNRISGAPVLDDYGKVVGVLSEKDCLNLVVQSGYHGRDYGYVEDYMSKEVVCVNSDLDLVHVTEEFIKYRKRRFPVIENGILIGVISRRDVLRAIQSLVESKA